MSPHSPTTSIFAKCWILQRNPTLISVSQLALGTIVCRQMLNIYAKSNIAYFANVGFRVNIQHFDPSVLSRQTKPHCGLRQFWGQFCLMLFLNLGACQITLKIRSFRSGRFWGRSDRNSFYFDLFPGEKRWVNANYFWAARAVLASLFWLFLRRALFVFWRGILARLYRVWPRELCRVHATFLCRSTRRCARY